MPDRLITHLRHVDLAVPDYDRQLVRAVRDYSPRGFHWADANTSYTLDTARALAPKFADLGLRALESPLPPGPKLQRSS